MSWECNCYKARERGREHQPGSHIVCPFCGRRREEVRLLEGVRNLLSWIDGGNSVEGGHLLSPLRDAVLAYHPFDGDEEPKRRATSVPVPESEENQLVFRDVPTVAVDLVVSGDVSAEERQRALGAGHRLWRREFTGVDFCVIAEDETRVVLRKLGGSELDNTYVRRDELVRDYVPCEAT